jgi:hypothetical protein
MKQAQVTLPIASQIWGDEKLDVIKEYGPEAGFSDLAIVGGGFMGSEDYETSDGLRAGAYFTASSDEGGYVGDVGIGGDAVWLNPDSRKYGIRPVLPPSVTSLIKPEEVRLSRKIGNIELVKYSELPLVITSKKISEELEGNLQANKLIPTDEQGFPYDGGEDDEPFKLVRTPAYLYDGRKYSRFLARPCDEDSVLSNGRVPNDGEPCWLEYTPWEWMKSKNGWWVSYLIVVAGIKFSEKKRYDGNFSKTNMYKYLGYLLPKVRN